MQENEKAMSSVKRTVFREEIRDMIREAIFKRDLKPGDRIIETYWAKLLGVSQAPVREAIRDLEAEGLVETVPFKGSRVKRQTIADISDNYNVRMCLEAMSVQKAVPLLTDDDIKTLEGYVEEMKHAAEIGSLNMLTSADRAFHKYLIEVTGNKILLRLWGQCNMLDWYHVRELNSMERLNSMAKPHMKILEGLKKRDVEEALEAMQIHLQQLMEQYIQDSEDE